MKVYIKHQMSCLPDQLIEIDVDHERRLVHLTMTVFDSALVAEVAKTVLPLPENGAAIVWRDDTQKWTDAWLTKPADYDLRINLAGVLYASEVVKLFDGGIAVTLEPLKPS